MLIRERADADDAACLDLLRRVHEADGYPRYVPEGLRRFLAPACETAAWVAELDGAVVGHVALHLALVDPTLEAAQRATGLPPERLAVVARLLVLPAVRRQGVGLSLLTHAVDHARAADQRAVLDVTQDAAAAIALYERAGWVRLESLTLNLEDKRLLLWVYISPEIQGWPVRRHEITVAQNPGGALKAESDALPTCGLHAEPDQPTDVAALVRFASGARPAIDGPGV